MSKLHNTQPITAHCRPGCINYLPSLSYKDLREAQEPLIPYYLFHIVPLWISLRAFLHLHRYAKIQHKARVYHWSPFGGVSYRHSLVYAPLPLYPPFTEGLPEEQHKKDLDSALQPSSKLQWVIWNENVIGLFIKQQQPLLFIQMTLNDHL